jgi:DNA gyrase subunit A
MSTKDEDAVTNLFVTSTHNPVLFFSNFGRVYRKKVWRLPEGGPTAKGRPMVNLLPLAEGEVISTVLPLPEDEAEWGGLHIMFATAHGTVRRNSMAAFTNIPTAGKIAMRFGTGAVEDSESDDNDVQADPTDRLIGVSLLTEDDDVFLATRKGKAIRFRSTDVREFQSRTSTGVRGVRLLADDEVISMSILRRVGTTQEEREAYLRCPPWRDREDVECTLSPERFAELAEHEQFILTVTENGYGKRSSAYEYRRTNRGGQGITNIDTSERNGMVVASFPVRQGEQLMLVTDQAKVIRTTVGDIRIAGRNTQGVTIFRVADNEHVVSVAKIDESEDDELEGEDGEELAPDDGAVTGESELERPADPEPED